MWFKSGTTILISSLSACAPCFSLSNKGYGCSKNHGAQHARRTS